jgi:A/G-specific adenine glycosylase
MAASRKGPSPRALGGLLDWYRRYRRDLPWRDTRDPYAIWVAEVMLQQTTVRAILPRFLAFLDRFGTIDSVATAREEEVLAEWSGLGYYHRARNLHRAARLIKERHAGEFPRTLPAALGLPGVGLYTASAVLSMAYSAPLPVVDGNVRRVLARVFGLRGADWRKDSSFYNLASELIDTRAPGDWNQAMMELGATVCRPRRPACPVCPVRRLCMARREALVDQLPEARARRPTVAVTVAVALIRKGQQVLLVRRPSGRTLANMWEVPQTGLSSRGLPDLERELGEQYALAVAVGPLLATARHTITFRRIRVEVYAARLERELPRAADRFRWVSPSEMGALPIAALTHKIMRASAAAQLPMPFS